MRTFSNLTTLLEKHVSNLKLPDTPKELYMPINYILEDGGKRMRPLLMLLSCEAFGGKVEQCIDMACGLEIFHNFTLLHDDIMDKAPIRRGRDTVHIKWNENIAILSGDAMVIFAYMQFAKSGVANVVLQKTLNIFNKAAIEVCEGQQFDMNFETSNDVTIEQYINMIRLKTSVLLAAGLEIGALVGGANEEQQKAMYEFGVNLGLAFQIQDDILDTFGDGATFGKNIGGDIAVGKKTYLYLTAYQRANQQQKEILTSSRDYNTVRNIYETLGVKQISLDAVQSFYDLSIQWLDKAVDNNNSIELKKYAQFLLNRNK